MVQHVKTARYTGQQVLDGAVKISQHDNARTIRDRHGIRLIFTVTGSIGKWAPFEIPVALAAGAALLSLLMLCLNSCVLNTGTAGCVSR